jgi:ABC-type cobalamin/Fe3+-siderophores transport system ATPase subunit
MNQQTLLNDLKAQITRGNVVIIAGTGVSITACGDQKIDGHPVARWDGLLFHGVDHCLKVHQLLQPEEAQLLNMQVRLAKPDFLVSAAELISSRLSSKSPGVYHRWLKDAVGALEPVQPEILRVLANFPGVLATLNYDPLFEKATDRVPVTWQERDKVEEILRDYRTDAVLHLHGYFDKPDSVVLGLGSYAKVAQDLHTKVVLQLFTLDRTLLFVGCAGTIKDPNFSRLVEWASEALKDSTHRHFLLCRENELPTVRADLKSAPWLHPVVYGKNYDDLIPFLRSLIPTPDNFPRPPLIRAPTGLGFDLDAYWQAMRKRYSCLKLEELDPTTHDIKPLTLTGMFIPQSARECSEFLPRVFELPKELQQRLRQAGELDAAPLDDEMLAQYRRAYYDQSPRPVFEVAKDPSFSRLVVLGDPGSGKSTLLQYLLLQWAEKLTVDLQDDPLPLLIELREYARLRHEGKVSGFLHFLHDGASVRWHFDQVQLDAWLKANPSLVFFDGLDEVFDPVERTEVATCIHRFVDQYPRTRVLVTSRIISYRHETWRDEEFRHFMLQELDETQIEDFLTRWHRDAYADHHDGDEKRDRLARAIADSPAIRQLAGNPLLLTMMAILNRTQDLPRDRAELYEQCARLLLHQWKTEMALAGDPELSKAALDYKDKRNLLLRVARAMQTSERGLAGNLIDEDTLERTLAKGLQDVPNLRHDRAARALIEQLRGRNFMLCSLGGRSYAFVHRTFLEYFCALEIRLRFEQEQTLTLEQLKTEVYGRHWADESWHEALCLLAGMIAPRFVAEILDFLLQQQDPEQTCQHVFLAARCVGEVRKRGELGTVAASVRQRIQTLVGFDLNYYYEPWEPETDKVRFIRTQAVALIAQSWSEDLETRAWLKARAQSDENWAVRQAAVRELARGWKDDPETLPILKARAQSDEDWAVRQAAVQELARGWKDDPETLSILKARAQSDENWAVRRAAVQKLVV